MAASEPNTRGLTGTYEELSDDGEWTEVESATMVSHADGRTDVVILRTEREYPWEARMSAESGSRQFKGKMWSSLWEVDYHVVAELWVSPAGSEEEFLLLGSCWCEGEEPTWFKLVLSEEEPEAGDRPR